MWEVVRHDQLSVPMKGEAMSKRSGLPRSGPAIWDGSSVWNAPLVDRNPARAWNPSSRSSLLESPGPSPGEDVMARQIEELLLLTCLGGFVAGITYAVTLVH